mgnify:CR=1 FL=1
MKVSRMQRLSMYVGLALVFGSTLSAPSVLAVDASDDKGSAYHCCYGDS